MKAEDFLDAYLAPFPQGDVLPPALTGLPETWLGSDLFYLELARDSIESMGRRELLDLVTALTASIRSPAGPPLSRAEGLGWRDALLAAQASLVATHDERGRELAALRDRLAEQARQMDQLHRLVAQKDAQIAEIYASTSWRLAGPWRWVGYQYRNLRALRTLSARIVRRHGGGARGLAALTRRAGQALLRGGVRELLSRTRAYGLRGLPYIPAEPLAGHDSASLRPHTASVAIIVCVHNALEDVQRCLESLIRYTFPPYQLILVDDGSREETRAYLGRFAQAQAAHLIRNGQARGYTRAANQGMRAAQADYSILLNSDTIVTADWLDRLVMCAESDARIGLVGPLSNTASWQSIPEIEDNGDWATNPLPRGVSIAQMGEWVAWSSARLYPRIGFLNGFCLMLKHRVIEELGYFDEEAFGDGYGEENDYCLRARKAGWSLAVADDVYIYHAQSRSYSHERRKQRNEPAMQALRDKHGQPIIDEGVAYCRHDRVIEGVRARMRHLFARRDLIDTARRRWEGKRILFILPIADAGGGGNVVVSEARALIDMGLDARLLNLSPNRPLFESSYPALDIPVIYADGEAEVRDLCQGFDAVVATLNVSVKWLAALAGQVGRRPVIGYYVQDFEPEFYSKGSAGYRRALASYSLIPDMVLMTKTRWNREQVRKHTDLDCALLGPSFAVDLFRPRPRREPSWPDRPLRIAAMIRPSTPRRAPRLTMEVLAATHETHGDKIEIVLFGADNDDPEFLALPRAFAWRNVGKQPQDQLAQLFNEIDIFVDFSQYQAMSLTSMEAMGCGAAVIVPELGGAGSFAGHERNALVVNTFDADACRRALDQLIADAGLRSGLQRQALWDIVQYHPEAAAFNLAEALFERTV